MSRYVVEGAYPISGRIKASGNKNAALPCLAATLLTEETVYLENIPDIEDIRVMLSILESLGARVEKKNPGEWEICCAAVNKVEIAEDEAAMVRASILFAGPMLGRFGRVVLPPPGGDVIGRRRLDTHFLALKALGASVEINGRFIISANKLVGLDLFLDEASVTATENALMAAVLAEGETIIRNAASEPHVQDLCRMLNAMGARIEGIGSNILRIKGVHTLGGCRFRIGSDYMEVGSFIGLAAVTGGSITIDDAGPEHLRMCRLAFGKLGINWKTDGSSIIVSADQNRKVVPDLGGMIPKIDDAPWPGFPPDLTSIITVVATQVEGTVLIHEKMFESRMFFVDKLIAMGAGIILCDPHRAVVTGPRRLRAAELTSPDVRAGMAMVIAAMAARGKSVIHNVYQIERGYENLTKRLCSLGARIERR
ncbi:MAG: UDP-N-acetylglucosamine 1-carboxyvinyltransferase [Spirochaeta sp. LUC14_002_19_P3]|nr:MAG: UDP-N-acetylglucosamine 1-carboxyvinyltransferase [Spirochaeta sp. LUC14_002_19_P3]